MRLLRVCARHFHDDIMKLCVCVCVCVCVRARAYVCSTLSGDEPVGLVHKVDPKPYLRVRGHTCL